MTKNKINEYDSLKKALNAKSDSFEVYERELLDEEKDFTNLAIGKYTFLLPVFKDNYSSFSPTPSWICFDNETKKYRIISKLNAYKLYLDSYHNSMYKGLEYITSDFHYTKLNERQYKTEYVEVINKYIRKTKDQKIKDYYIDKLKSVDECIRNLRINLEFYKSLKKESYINELNRVVKTYNFFEVDDISSYSNCLYIVALDEYKQFYVGKSVNGLKNRMRKHWTAKVIPGRELWEGGVEYSRVKFDTFKMFDCTRIFVCTNIDSLVANNMKEANDKGITFTNTFREEKPYEQMTYLDKAERIVINNCRCKYCLSDRVPLVTWSHYKTKADFFIKKVDDLLIKDFNRVIISFDGTIVERQYKERFDKQK